jgi:hypothetical protein
VWSPPESSGILYDSFPFRQNNPPVTSAWPALSDNHREGPGLIFIPQTQGERGAKGKEKRRKQNKRAAERAARSKTFGRPSPKPRECPLAGGQRSRVPLDCFFSYVIVWIFFWLDRYRGDLLTLQIHGICLAKVLSVVV